MGYSQFQSHLCSDCGSSNSELIKFEAEQQ